MFFRFEAKKISYFSLGFALSEYERRTLGAPVSLIYFFRFKAKKIPYFSLSFALSKYERRTLPLNPPPLLSDVLYTLKHMHYAVALTFKMPQPATLHILIHSLC